tara:strand:+ start:94 stop:468 length:375 start_codon:yes stop_codon:yes gene_type:complete
MVIPIDKIGEVVAETFRQIKTGVLTVRTEGVAIVELPDQKYGANGVQFSMTVVAKDGLNAVERKQTQTQDASTVTEQVEEGFTSIRSEESTKNSGAASSTQNTSQTGSSGAGGSNTVTTTYEYE